MTMIERAAQAQYAVLRERDPSLPTWDDLLPEDRAFVCRHVRAGMEAIREPNEAMLRACLGDTYDSDRYEAAATWQAMIDALLAEASEP